MVKGILTLENDAKLWYIESDIAADVLGIQDKDSKAGVEGSVFVVKVVETWGSEAWKNVDEFTEIEASDSDHFTGLSYSRVAASEIKAGQSYSGLMELETSSGQS